MDRLDQLIRALADSRALVSEISREVFKDPTVQADILDANAAQLRERGRNAEGVDGVEIASYRPYAPLTSKLKAMKGLDPFRVTLRDTGEFHRSFEIDFTPDGFIINASDPKTLDLVEKYGEDVLGLTQNQVDELRGDVIFITFAEKLREKLEKLL